MNLLAILQNKVLIAVLSAWLLAQILKIPTEYLKSRRWLWAMFFAIVDRDRVTSVTNACVRLEEETGAVHGPFYVFSVSQSALPNQPWRTGTVYLLPRNSFITQSPMAFGSSKVHIAQLASLAPVQPLAKLTVTPDDFPFLSQIRGHDDQRIQEYATALQTGAPWPGLAGIPWWSISSGTPRAPRLTATSATRTTSSWTSTGA